MTRIIIKEVGCHYVFEFKGGAIPKEAQSEVQFKLEEEFEYILIFDPSNKSKVIF